MSDRGARFVGGSGGMLPQKNFQIKRLRNGIFNVLHEIFLCLKMTGSNVVLTVISWGFVNLINSHISPPSINPAVIRTLACIFIQVLSVV